MKKTIEQIHDEINNYIFAAGRMKDYTEEMMDIVFDAELGIKEMEKELERENGGKFDHNDPIFDEWEKESDDIVAKAAQKIFDLQK